jgi:prepilin-type N-terminal cleavage/methylation domain-containing protein
MINAKESGFTFIELLITLTVITVLLAAAVPYLGDFAKNNRLIMCPSSNQTSCSADAADWQNGWLVFSDFNINGSLEPGASAPLCEETEDCLMRTGNGLTHNNTLTTTATLLRFLPTGMASNGGAVDFTIVSDDCRIDQVRNVRVTSQGHTIVSTQTCP